jgi:flagellar FliL protein
MANKEKEPKKQDAAPKADVTAAEAPGKKGGKGKLIIIVVLAMIIGGGGMFAAMRFLMKPAGTVVAESAGEDKSATVLDSHAEEDEPIVAPSKSDSGHGGGTQTSAGEGGSEALVQEGPITVELKPFTTNLNEPSGRRFLKVTMGMEVDNQEAADELNRKMPDIQDTILILLSSQSTEDIATVDGKERLRSQILNRTNVIMTKNKVRKVKYSEFIIQ